MKSYEHRQDSPFSGETQYQSQKHSAGHIDGLAIRPESYIELGNIFTTNYPDKKK